ncbi:MAG: Fructose-phosphate phosphatase YqaB [Verrucomicrobiota bacterium]
MTGLPAEKASRKIKACTLVLCQRTASFISNSCKIAFSGGAEPEIPLPIKPKPHLMTFSFDPPTKEYVAYIFDCDGTLADSMPIHLKAWNHGLEAAMAPFQLTEKGFMSVAGMALQQTLDHWNRTHDAQIDAATVIHAKNGYYLEHRHLITAIAPVVAFAKACKARGAKVAVASGGIREDVIETLRIIGLEDFFPVITTADDVAYAKPAPDLFLLAAQRLGVNPADCLVLEDSPLGIEAADLAGMDSLLLPSIADLTRSASS